MSDLSDRPHRTTSAALSPAPRRRRVRREATDGVAEEARELLGAEPDPPAADRAGDGEQPPAQGSDEWWEQQRPPHWS